MGRLHRWPSVSLFATAISICAATSAVAQWEPDGNAVCALPGWQGSAVLASDGAGGVIVAWRDNRAGLHHTYAQRIDVDGHAWWTKDGVAVCTKKGDVECPAIVSDGQGGVIIAWRDQRNGDFDLYAQKVDAAGKPQWEQDGLALCTAAGDQSNVAITTDGQGGAIVTWMDSRIENDADIYAGKVSASGEILWNEDGEPVCTALGNQGPPVVIADGAGGAIIAWFDSRAGDSDIYAQGLDADGAAKWTEDGKALSIAEGDQESPNIVSDGEGGAIVAWMDSRGGGTDIYAHRIDALGNPQWEADGVAVCTFEGNQQYPELTPDGAGGAIIAWVDRRSGPDIYSQRVGSKGQRLWDTDGVPLCSEESAQGSPKIASDAAGGAIVVWDDFRSGVSGEQDIYAQRVAPDGTIMWMADGFALCAASGSQRYPEIIPDGSGGALVCWFDRRGADRDVYALRVHRTGTVVPKAGGRPVSATAWQHDPDAISDGQGGAIVAMGCTGGICVQRVDHHGELKWGDYGVALGKGAPCEGCYGYHCERLLTVVRDDAGGAIVVWVARGDVITGGEFKELLQIHAQRVDAQGTLLWEPEGVLLHSTEAWEDCEVSGFAAVSDGHGGAIVVWADETTTATLHTTVTLYAQKIDESGTPMWDDTYLSSPSGYDTYSLRVAGDGEGRAIVTWVGPVDDDLSANNWSIYAQGVDGEGSLMWGETGIVVHSLPGKPEFSALAPDGEGGAIVVYRDKLNGDWDIYAQRFNDKGELQWGDGKVVCSAAGDQVFPSLCTNGGSAIVVWEDRRSGDRDIYAQQLDEQGNSLWEDGVLLCGASGDQRYPTLISGDGESAIVVWRDERKGSRDVYGQMVNDLGELLWAEDGMALCVARGGQGVYAVVSDGAGGAIAAWGDLRSRSSKVYAQRLDASGRARWKLCGTHLCTTDTADLCVAPRDSGGVILAWDQPYGGQLRGQRLEASGAPRWGAWGKDLHDLKFQYAYAVVSDNSGGMIVAWQEKRIENWDIRAERVDASGKRLWTSGYGRLLCTDAQDQVAPTIVSDGDGGAFVVWEDLRNDNWDIYGQHVLASGEIDWGKEGVAICLAEGPQRNPQAIPDGGGGVIVVWEDKRSGNWDIYAKKVNSVGVTVGPPHGTEICAAVGNQENPVLVTDGAYGAIVAWADRRSGNWEIYAQRVNPFGLLLWPTDVPLCTASGSHDQPQIVSDGNGGAVVTWRDLYRQVRPRPELSRFASASGPQLGSGTSNAYVPAGIYAQRVSGLGEVQWYTDGMPLCYGRGWVGRPAITTDAAGGAIVVWQDLRSCNPEELDEPFPTVRPEDVCSWDIFTQRIDASGRVRWTKDGVAICTARTRQVDPMIFPHGTGGAVVLWCDHQAGNNDIYARWVTALGELNE